MVQQFLLNKAGRDLKQCGKDILKLIRLLESTDIGIKQAFLAYQVLSNFKVEGDSEVE